MRSHQDPKLLSAFAAEVRSRRDTQGRSQEELAHACGLNRTFIAKLELGKTSPSLTTLFRLAEGLTVAPQELVDSVQKRLLKELALRDSSR